MKIVNLVSAPQITIQPLSNLLILMLQNLINSIFFSKIQQNGRLSANKYLRYNVKRITIPPLSHSSLLFGFCKSASKFITKYFISNKALQGLTFKMNGKSHQTKKTKKNLSICRFFLILKMRHEPVYAAFNPKRLN